MNREAIADVRWSGLLLEGSHGGILVTMGKRL